MLVPLPKVQRKELFIKQPLTELIGTPSVRFVNNKNRYGSIQSNFLRHVHSGANISMLDKACFSNWMKKYLSGKLIPDERSVKQRDKKQRRL